MVVFHGRQDLACHSRPLLGIPLAGLTTAERHYSQARHARVIRCPMSSIIVTRDLSLGHDIGLPWETNAQRRGGGLAQGFA